MKRPPLVFALASLGLVLSLAGQETYAQMPYGQPNLGPYSRPVLSPYLNLARPGNAAINYYGLVVPQNQFAGGLNTLQQQVTANQSGIAALGAQDPLTAALLSLTGHQISFMNYRRYFLNFTPVNPLALSGYGTGAMEATAQGTAAPAVMAPAMGQDLIRSVPAARVVPLALPEAQPAPLAPGRVPARVFPVPAFGPEESANEKRLAPEHLTLAARSTFNSTSLSMH
jgi:hypothetical protein